MGKFIFINKNILQDLYFKEKLSLNQIGKKLKLNSCTAEARLEEYGFKLRNKWEAKKLINQSGKNNSNYIDGRCSKKYYCACGKEIHHIDYDKKNCNENNLITLCLRCHRKTNANRRFWQYYFNFFKIN